MKCGALLGIGLLVSLLASTTAQGELLFQENFGDLNRWTVSQPGPGGSITVSNGLLHVVNGSGSSNPVSAGLYTTAPVAPVEGGQVYFFGLTANGSRTPANADNSAGPVGSFTLSSASGLHWFDNTPAGWYIRNRNLGGGLAQTEAQGVINNDNPGPFLNIDEGISVDLSFYYTDSSLALFYKRSDSLTWKQLGNTATITPGASPYYLGLTAVSDFFAGLGEGADWTLDQIDVQTLDSDPLLTVPEPSSLALLLAPLILLKRRGRAKDLVGLRS